MKKKIFILLILVVFCTTGFSLGQDVEAKKFKDNNRQLLKEYFFACCMINGFPEKKLYLEDHSISYYVDAGWYGPTAYNIMDSLSRSFINSIPYSDYEGTNTRGIIVLSLEYYHSNELDSIVKSMDKYMVDYEYYKEE